MTYKVCFIAFTSFFVAATTHADSMRCGSSVVQTSTTPAEILAKCGEPSSKEVQTEDVYVRSVKGGTSRTGVTTTEIWIYRKNGGAIPMKIIIVDGKTKSIERAE